MADTFGRAVCRRTLLGFLLIATIFLPLGSRPVAGREKATLPTTDIVLVIDESGSTAESDPDNLRVEAARQLVDTVALYADAYPVRVGAVTFGSPYIGNSGNSVKLVKALTPATTPGLREVFPVARVPGTDFDAALCLAWSVTSQSVPAAGCPTQVSAEAVRAGEGPVQSRVVVLITDGFPAPRGVDLSFAPGESPQSPQAGSPGHAYMSALRNRWQALTAQTSVSLYVIGIDRTNRWFPTTEPYWRAITGCQGETACSVAVRRSLDPKSLANDILNAGTGNLINLCRQQGSFNECELPASLAEALFVVRDLSPNDQVRIRNPAGQEVQSGEGVVVTASEDPSQRPGSAKVETWRIRAPQKGLWRVESSRLDARLSVTQVLVPQRFQMQVVPKAPTRDSAVSFELRPEGELLVDLPSLLNETLQLRLQPAGQDETRYAVRLVENAPGVLKTEPSIMVGSTGWWSASLVLPIRDYLLLLGSTAFAVDGPSPSLSPISAPTPQPTAALPPPCQIALGPSTSPVERYSPALVWGYPLRFSEGQEFSAEMYGEGCSDRKVDLVLRLVPNDDLPSPCGSPYGCEWRVERQRDASIRVQLDEETLRTTSLRRFASASYGTDWETHSEDEVNLVTPPLVELERRSLVGWWLPWVTVLAILYGISYASSRQLVEGANLPGGRARIRDIAIPGRRSQPLVRRGGFIWRRYKPSSSQNDAPVVTIALRYLVVGPPVGRVWAAPPSDGEKQPLARRVRIWLASLRKFVVGTPIDQLGITFILRGPR